MSRRAQVSGGRTLIDVHNPVGPQPTRVGTASWESPAGCPRAALGPILSCALRHSRPHRAQLPSRSVDHLGLDLDGQCGVEGLGDALRQGLLNRGEMRQGPPVERPRATWLVAGRNCKGATIEFRAHRDPLTKPHVCTPLHPRGQHFHQGAESLQGVIFFNSGSSSRVATSMS